ncbi:hypothetical protein N665_0087s0001, partial [Sinapis alba]
LSGFNTSNLSLSGKNYVIHGFIPAGGANHYRPSLREGSIVKVGSFEVIRCTNMYKITDHPFVIRIIPLTTIDEVARTLIVINLHKFMLQEFDHLQALATTNLVFPDVVGQISFVQGSDMNNSELIISHSSYAVVYLSLWNDTAAKFRGLLNSGDKSQFVMVVTTVNPKIFGGGEAEVYPRVDTMEGIKKKLVSIGDLHAFISNSSEKIVGVLQENGWLFVSCTSCSRKLIKSGTSFRCNGCVMCFFQHDRCHQV